MMTPNRATVGSRVAALTLVALVALAGSYWLFVGTALGQRFDLSAYTGRDSVPHRYANVANDVLDSVEIPTLVAVVIVLVLVGIVRGMWLRGLCAAGGFGIAICAAEVLKRALPRRDLVPGSQDAEWSTFNGFPSGHTTIFVSAVLAVTLLSPVAVRAWVAVAGAVVATGASSGVLIIGWHRGSEAIGGVALSLAALSCASLLVLMGERSGAIVGVDGPSAGSRWIGAGTVAAIIVVATLAALWLVVALFGDRWLMADRAFALMTSMIVLVTWLAVMGFAWTIRQLR